MLYLFSFRQGFSLLEVLLALFVLGFGLLGLAILQGKSIRSDYNAYLQSIAVSRIYSGFMRKQVGLQTQEMRIWQQITKQLLPNSSSSYKNNVFIVCWYSRLNGRRNCLEK